MTVLSLPCPGLLRRPVAAQCQRWAPRIFKLSFGGRVSHTRVPLENTERPVNEYVRAKKSGRCKYLEVVQHQHVGRRMRQHVMATFGRVGQPFMMRSQTRGNAGKAL